MTADIDSDIPTKLYIGDDEPPENPSFWFDTSWKKYNDKINVKLNLVSDSENSEIKAEIDDTLYGVENAGTGSDSELRFTIL